MECPKCHDTLYAERDNVYHVPVGIDPKLRRYFCSHCKHGWFQIRVTPQQAQEHPLPGFSNAKH